MRFTDHLAGFTDQVNASIYFLIVKTSNEKMLSKRYYILQEDDVSRFVPDQTIIIKKSHLQDLPGMRFEEDSSDPLIASEDWYPMVNSYYSFTEDVDAFARVNHLLESRRSLTSLATLRNDDAAPFNPYSERAGHYEYLRRSPVSFFVTGKPGLGEEELGKRLSEYWKCVHITPLSLLEEEIESGSRVGRCIEFNLRCGRAVGVDVIMRLLARKLQTPAVLHRGFVLCGFPLIPNDLYEEDPISSESAVFNVQEIFEDIIEQTVQSADTSNKMVVSMIGSAASPEQSDLDEVVEDEFAIDSDFKMSCDYVIEDAICGPKEISNDLQKQLNCLFGLFQQQFLLIYMYASNRDVVSKRNRCYFDVYSKNALDMEKIELFHEMGASNEELIEDLFDGGRNPFADNPDLKHVIKLPENFPANVNSQLKRYRDEIANVLDCRVLMHDVQYYLKLDARAFLSRMMRLIKMRLKILPLQPVIEPQRFRVEREEFGEGDDEEPEHLSLDDHFRKLSKTDIVSPVFKWTWSDWGVHCPVSLSRGVYAPGSPEFAVHFLNRIFFLRDREALEAFVGNPRPFLLPPFPRPGSRVFVFGPPISGKSAVAKCLGYLLNSRVLTPGQLHTEYVAQLVTEHRDRVKQAALVEGLELLTESRRTELEERREKRERSIEEWEDEAVIILNELKIYLEEFIQDRKNVIGSFPVELEKATSYTDFFNMEQGNVIKERLLALNLPLLANPTKCEELLEDREQLLKFLPRDLKTEPAVEPATVFDPFVLEYAEKKVEEMNVEEINTQAESNEYQVYVRGIKSTEEEAEYDGWIIDDMTTNLSLLNQILEEYSVDEVVMLNVADPDFLRTQFQRHDKVRTDFCDFHDFFLGIGEEAAALRSSSVTSTSYRDRVVRDVLSEVLRFERDEEEIEREQRSALAQYDRQLKKYSEEIGPVRDFFKKKGIEVVEVDVGESGMAELLKKVVWALRDKYRPTASEFSDADRAEEVRQFFVEPAGGGEGENEVKPVDDFFAENRRYGDTWCYCPVTFSENFVLWRGKEQFAAKFREKVYLTATERDLKKFIKSPRSYLLQSRPPDRFPPPRICIVGPIGSGKSTVSKVLVKNLGVRYFDFQEMLKQAVNKISSLSITLREEEDELIPDALLLSWYEALVKRLWFEEPNKYIGFVLDDFPRQARDIQFLIGKKAIPDLVVCMSLSREDTVNRVLSERVEEWRVRNEEDRLIDETLRSLELKNWEERRKRRYEELMEERRQQRYAEKKKETAPIADEGNDLGFTSDTQVSFDSVVEQQEEDEVMKILNEEYPEPFFRHTAETEEEIVERVTAEVEKKHAHAVEHLDELKKICEEHLIPWVEVDAKRSVEQIATHLFVLTEDVKYRGRSFFERCYDVDLETAEKLLAAGYYFLPIFGRNCPVQYQQGRNPLQIYFAGEADNAIYPVIHRNYIYFVHGKKNREKFVKEPLDYVYPKKYDFVQVPMRVAVIGPPKSGKSTLATRFRRGLGFNTVTRGQAIREVLNHPLYSNLREPMEKELRKGDELDEETVMDCVYAASHCGECVTFGLVFDGFPNDITEMNSLSRLGMVPHLIYDLQVSDEDVFHFSNGEKYPPYSRRYVEHLLEQWRAEEKEFRTWCDREYQNIYRLPVDRSIWGVWERANQLVQSVAYERKHYYKHARSDWPLRLAYMLVTPLEFLERQSNYRTHCPVCIYHSQTFKSGGDPPDRSGLIHFRHFFYWICEEHVEEFLKSPETFIPPSNRSLPQDLPKRVVLKKAPEAGDVAENGFCLVCYWKNVPKKVIRRGSNQHACSYKNKIYLFESAACATEFLANPVEYYQLTINFKDDAKYASLNYRDLPVLGMLEQFVARTVVRAVSHVNLLRPVIPGLSVSAAALICVGLNLKIHNRKIAKEYRVKYEEALKIFHRRRSDLIRYLDLMKRYLNPEVHYEEPPDTPEEEEEEEDEDYDHELADKLNKEAVM